MSTEIDRLRGVPLFGGLDQEALERIAALASEVTFQDGEAVVREGDAGHELYVLTDGRLSVTRDGKEIRELKPGDFLGEISLIDGQPRTATATAVGPVKALVIHHHDFFKLMDSYITIRLGIVMALARRIRRDQGDDLV